VQKRKMNLVNVYVEFVFGHGNQGQSSKVQSWIRLEPFCFKTANLDWDQHKNLWEDYRFLSVATIEHRIPLIGSNLRISQFPTQGVQEEEVQS